MNGAVDTPHQLAIVANDDFQCQHALLAYRLLLLQIDDALAQREQQLLLDKGTLRLFRRQPFRCCHQTTINQSSQVDLTLELAQQAAQALLIVTERNVIAAQHIATALQVGNDRIQGFLGIFKLAKIALNATAGSGKAGKQTIERPCRQALLMWIKLLHALTQIAQCLRHRPPLIALVGQLAQWRLQHLAVVGRLPLQLKPHFVHCPALAMQGGIFTGQHLVNKGRRHTLKFRIVNLELSAGLRFRCDILQLADNLLNRWQ